MANTNLVSVHPILDIRALPCLTFFSTEEFCVGELIEIRLSGRKVKAIVWKINIAGLEKKALKELPYKLKSLRAKKVGISLGQNFINFVKTLSVEFPAEIGHFFNLVLPRLPILKSISVGLIEIKLGHSGNAPTSTLEGSSEDRVRYIFKVDSKISKPAIICLPSIYFAEQYTALVKSVTNHDVPSIHSNQGASTCAKKIRAFLGGKQAFVITTPAFIGLLAPVAKQIIVEQAGGNYMTFWHPRIDQRRYLDMYAKYCGLPLIYADSVVPVELYWADEGMNSINLKGTATSKIDVQTTNDLISQESKLIIDGILEKGGKVLILSHKRGLAHISLCGDCGTLVTCKACANPLVLRQDEGGTKYFCYRCGSKEDSELTCLNCSSWNIKTFGGGIERVVSDVKQSWPSARLFIISKDTEGSMSVASGRLEDQIKNTDIVVSIGAFVPYLTQPFDLTIISDTDTLLSVPEYRAREKLYRHLKIVAENTLERVVVQTRFPEANIFTCLTSGKNIEFKKLELAERRKFGYPPFVNLVTLTIKTFTPRLANLASETLNKLMIYQPLVVIEGVLGHAHSKMLLVFKVKADAWPNREMNVRLQELTGQNIELEVNT